ncbi:hypothetical protein Pse7429DRAFT_2923, partial [Pseudanabaena biceps PCC 7429]|uniref:Uncharacterized protein n=1 Tax=Pseudanabaena biceps PCC 7429 TaxID=927668 RepID=L8MUZ4_9CYAN
MFHHKLSNYAFTVLCAQTQTKEIFESVEKQRFQEFPWSLDLG